MLHRSRLSRLALLLPFLALAVIPSASAAPGAPTDVTLLQRNPTSALISWKPGTGTAHGFKLRPSSVPGVHPNPTTFPNGKLAAFTYTTDDGLDDNLIYNPLFTSRGLNYSIFLIPGQIGLTNYLTWNDVRFLYEQGHEIANHTYHHKSLIDDRCIALRYVGAQACSLAVSGGHLRTWVGGVLDLDVTLNSAPVAYTPTLASFLDADPDYEATRLGPPDTVNATRSQFIDPISGKQIGAGALPETLTTDRGVHDVAELTSEVLASKTVIESQIQPIDPAYQCRTLAYPNHAHYQWSMSHLNEFGIFAARSGGKGTLPFWSNAFFKLGFNSTYEVPITYPQVLNSWTETQTRTTITNRIAQWKTNREWAVMMSHDEAGVDAAHVEWTIDTVAADPQVWFARFDEVAEFIAEYFIDPGYPFDATSGTCSAWIHGLEPSETVYVVITAYDDLLAESSWSSELTVGPHGASAAPAVAIPTSPVRVFPDPFSGTTSVEFLSHRGAAARVGIFDVAGRMIDDIQLGAGAAGTRRFTWDGRARSGQVLGSGVYWFRIDDGDATQTGRVHLVR